MSAEITPIPRIGDDAPDFTAITTHGEITFSNWQGDDWVILFSHPADFTPVCTTELTEFADRNNEFADRGIKLIGLSIDSIHSHVAWVQNINEIMGTKIPYPLIADLDMKVANKYGLIHPGESSTATVRAVFIIDPNRKIRALIYYPLANGRNVDEVVRLVDSLQTTDSNSCATPVNWNVGEKVIVPPPKTEAEVEERLNSDHEKLSFYLMKRDL
ncbi:peroxiredoxin [Candidatus Poribacteria bacterium]|jgi:peroxiredoxin (alkyl hydroperoxide reductase subunit C)|nr:peroxiredoxin [Candidatus Poribacteria bacterium]MCS5611359.1 peroxiredoxin [Candidatus Poribacteria bacterium]MEC8894230.1 peroxiredoxin [Candidatus Poribacteria bacterium]MEC9258321.1 peroxiredoxin [Candidatus Poribacteria bacterium]|tara:strand:+ start:1233 stop:1877 length:645 start_codon:yes stop_codon:yes gene_type:complete